MMLAFVMRNGDRVDNPLGWAVSRELGRGYRYLPSNAGGVASFVFELRVTEDVAFVEVSFRTWRPIGEVSVEGIRIDVLRRTLRSAQSKSASGPSFDGMSLGHRIPIAAKSITAPVSFDVEPGFAYALSIAAVAEGSPPNAFVLQPHFDRIDGTPTNAAPKGFGISRRYGHFVYVNPGEAVIKFTAPSEAKQLRLSLHPWGASVGQVELALELRVLSMPTEAIDRRIGSELEALLSAADPHGTFLCIYTGTKRIGEGNRANRSMMFAREAARLGISTVYTYSPSEGETDFNRTSDRLLQVPLHSFGAIAGTIAQRAPGRSRLLLGSMPDVELARQIGLFRYHGWTYVYECRDEWEEFAGVGSAGWFDEAFERYATQQASKVFCVSPTLQAKMRRYTSDPNKVLVSPNATTDEFLAVRKVARSSARARHAAAPSPTPRIGYFGHLTEQWFDWGALLRAARRLPNASFDIIGFDMPDMELGPNVRYLGSKTHDEIIEIARDWDVGVIPFRPGRLSRAVDPIKVYEYLALGLKVVSIPMGSLETFPLTFCYDEFGLGDALAKAIAYRPTEDEWERVDAVLQRTSWRWRLLDLLAESGVFLPASEQAHAA